MFIVFRLGVGVGFVNKWTITDDHIRYRSILYLGIGYLLDVNFYLTKRSFFTTAINWSRAAEVWVWRWRLKNTYGCIISLLFGYYSTLNTRVRCIIRINSLCSSLLYTAIERHRLILVEICISIFITTKFKPLKWS